MAQILIIDDEAEIIFLLKHFLTSEGHAVDTAENGKIGVKLTELHHYDLVISDMHMPEMDGIEVITAIKAKSPATRIIVLSGGSARFDTSNLLTTAKAIGANKVFAKPLDLKALLAAVNEVLAS
jgi:DNA-binding response OmpR family regulator